MTNNKKRRLMEQAKEWIRDFLEREYGDSWEEDFDNLSHITLAFVLSDDEMTETEIAVDLINCRVNTYLGDEQIHIRQINFRNIEELVNALPKLDFQKLADISRDEIDELDRRLTDAFNRSMRTGGKCRMEVKCLEEDWAK